MLSQNLSLITVKPNTYTVRANYRQKHETGIIIIEKWNSSYLSVEVVSLTMAS
jgi:hypothetical protein